MTTKWNSVLNASDFIVEFENEAVFYNPLSGETHQLNLLAVDVLKLLEVSMTLKQLAEQTASLYQIALEPELTMQLQQLIEQFDDLGMIESCSV